MITAYSQRQFLMGQFLINMVHGDMVERAGVLGKMYDHGLLILQIMCLWEMKM